MIQISKNEEERALSIHQKAIVIDGCNPLLMWDVDRMRRQGKHAVLKNMDYPMMEEGGITASVATLHALPWLGYPQEKGAIRFIHSIDAMYLDLVESSDKMLLATTSDHIRKAKREGKIAVLFGFQRTDPLERSLSLLRSFYKLGVRVMQLTYNEKNAVGDGCHERTNAGLSNFGVEVVEEMNKLGMVIDLSHAGEATFMDALKFTKSPVIASHSSCRSICNFHRNLKDEQIKALAENDGVIGVVAVPEFVGPTVENLVDHIDYIIKLVGVNHVGLGLDLTDRVRSGYPMDPPSSGFSGKDVKGIEDVTKTPNITKVLVARGYADKEIEKILGGNFLRIFKEVMGS